MPSVEPDAEAAAAGASAVRACSKNGGASLATILALIRSGEATTRLDIERAAELGRAVVADRLAALETLGLIVEGELGPAIGGRAPRNMRFRREAGAVLAAHVDRASLAVGLADLDRRPGRRASRGGGSRARAGGDPRPAGDAVPLAARRARRQIHAPGRSVSRCPNSPASTPMRATPSASRRLDALRAWRSFDFATELSPCASARLAGCAATRR